MQKEIGLRQKGYPQMYSWEGLPCICESSGLQFWPNPFYNTVETPCVMHYIASLTLQFPRGVYPLRTLFRALVDLAVLTLVTILP